MNAYAACIYGLGGSMLDPAGGMATLESKIATLGVQTAAQPWDQNNVEALAAFLKTLPSETLIFIIGDSCGANKAPWVAAELAPRPVAYIACIQASVYCQTNCPDITSNVGQAFIVYSDWAHTDGLGCYIPIRAAGNTTTKYRQSFVPAAHPDDWDVANVQDPILKDIQAILDNAARQS